MTATILAPTLQIQPTFSKRCFADSVAFLVVLDSKVLKQRKTGNVVTGFVRVCKDQPFECCRALNPHCSKLEQKLSNSSSIQNPLSGPPSIRTTTTGSKFLRLLRYSSMRFWRLLISVTCFCSTRLIHDSICQRIDWHMFLQGVLIGSSRSTRTFIQFHVKTVSHGCFTPLQPCMPWVVHKRSGYEIMPWVQSFVYQIL